MKQLGFIAEQNSPSVYLLIPNTHAPSK